MSDLTPLPATRYVEQLNIGRGRRALAIGLAVAITTLLLWLIISWSAGKPPQEEKEFVKMVSLQATKASPEKSQAPTPSQERDQRTAPEPRPDEPQPSQPAPTLPPPPTPPPPQSTPPPAAPVTPSQPAAKSTIGVRPPSGQVYGPPDTRPRSSSAFADTERVGTAPNGEPMYAAAWYREPSADELRGYLSTADGPGWGLIACRTAPDYRVESCVGLDEYPNGSRITNAVLAAAWQFRVRPPRVGGKLMVGTWVRIRIDYRQRPR